MLIWVIVCGAQTMWQSYGGEWYWLSGWMSISKDLYKEGSKYVHVLQPEENVCLNLDLLNIFTKIPKHYTKERIGWKGLLWTSSRYNTQLLRIFITYWIVNYHAVDNILDSSVDIYGWEVLKNEADGSCTVHEPHVIFTSSSCGEKTENKDRNNDRNQVFLQWIFKNNVCSKVFPCPLVLGQDNSEGIYESNHV